MQQAGLLEKHTERGTVGCPPHLQLRVCSYSHTLTLAFKLNWRQTSHSVKPTATAFFRCWILTKQEAPRGQQRAAGRGALLHQPGISQMWQLLWGAGRTQSHGRHWNQTEELKNFLWHVHNSNLPINQLPVNSTIRTFNFKASLWTRALLELALAYSTAFCPVTNDTTWDLSDFHGLVLLLYLISFLLVLQQSAFTISHIDNANYLIICKTPHVCYPRRCSCAKLTPTAAALHGTPVARAERESRGSQTLPAAAGTALWLPPAVLDVVVTLFSGPTFPAMASCDTAQHTRGSERLWSRTPVELVDNKFII